MRRAFRIVGIVIVAAVLAVSIGVEREAPYIHESLGGTGPRALVLYHPSRDARFADEISMAVAQGLRDAGYSVERATITRRTPGDSSGVAFIAVVSNTYWWTPDLPTLRFLRRARLTGIPAYAFIGGAGSTGRSERVLADALRATGATVIGTRSLWIWRPNDEHRMQEPNRRVADERGHRADAGRRALASGARAR
ncbi:MAG: hypothetical protein U0163_16725 [Gemmatimonadaceae bacterium]